MNKLLYKKKLIEKKYEQKEKYSLNRENIYFQKYYEIQTTVKYGQSKFFANKEQIKNLIIGSYVEANGLFENVTIKKIEENYFYLSRPVLSYGIIKFSFKCKLNLGDSWLDWDNNTWKEKINNSSSEFKFNQYKKEDSYFLKIKNKYESRCLYPAESYYVREIEAPEVLENVYCGNSIVNTNDIEDAYCGNSIIKTNNIEDIYCGENTRYMGQLSCNDEYSLVNISGELSCEDQQVFAGLSECGDKKSAS